MAIDVDWEGNDANPYRIYVPRADMPVTQVSPEIRELDADAFRLELGDLMASVEGIPYPKTHLHKQESVLSGITYARSVEIVAPYTLEFEDAQYAVNVVGANTNFLDVKVANQVSLLGNNSGGLINLSNILATLDYQGSIWIDTVNGQAGIIKGTNGTPSNPSDNLADALTLAGILGVRSLRILTGTVQLTATLQDFDVILGSNATVDLNGQNVNGSEFSGGFLTGACSGTWLAKASTLTSVSGFAGDLRGCTIDVSIALGVGASLFYQCASRVEGTAQPILDFVGAGRLLSNRGWIGGLDVRNMNDPTNVATLDFQSGSLTLASTCSDGELVYRGIVGPVDDNSTGTVITNQGWIDPTSVRRTLYQDKFIHIDTANGVAGSTTGIHGTESNPVNNETDALTLAAAVGTDRFRVAGALTLTTDYSGWSFEAAHAEALIDLNGRSIEDCIFREVQVFGTMVAGTNRNTFDHAALVSVSGFSGVAESCRLFGTIGMADKQTLFLRCSGGDDSAELDYTAVTTGAPPTTITGYQGALSITNVTRPQDMAINLDGGTLDLAASCTNGAFEVTGAGTLTDSTTGTATVNDGSLLDPERANKAALAAALAASS